MPKPPEQLEAALSTQLRRADKQALDLLAAWPFSTPEQLAGLMGGVTRRRANQVLRSLRRCSLVQREPDGIVLSDEGLTTLARRDRAAVGPTLDRWTPQQSEGVYFGTALRALASQAEHQQGITEFAASLSAEVGHDPDYELLDLLPTHRSQITYHAPNHQHFVLHPDASFQLSYQGDWDWCLLEYERRAVTPKRVPERLRGYRRYFQTDYAWRDHGGVEPLVWPVGEGRPSLPESCASIFERTPVPSVGEAARAVGVQAEGDEPMAEFVRGRASGETVPGASKPSWLPPT